MPECASCRLYLLLDSLENFDIALDLRSRAISNFPSHLEVKYNRKETHTGIIFYIYLPVAAAVRRLLRRCCKTKLRTVVTRGLTLRRRSATFHATRNRLRKRSIVF